MARSKLLPKNNQKEYSSICTATKATPDASTVRIANECFYAYENNSPKKRKFLRHSFPEIRLFFHASGSAVQRRWWWWRTKKSCCVSSFSEWNLPHTVDRQPHPAAYHFVKQQTERRESWNAPGDGKKI